ncbi:MAG TPA: hypothetical protein VGL38_08905 [bacterium]|jgi:hypothetical protein
MYACQWHFDIPFGKQTEVLDIMKRWEEEIDKDPQSPKGRGRRLMVGHVGASASHIIHEHLVDELSDWDHALKIVATGRFQKYSDSLAPFIVPGSQHWIIYRVHGITTV